MTKKERAQVAMTKSERERLRGIVAKATPGPWSPNVWIQTDGNEWRATGPGHDDEDENAYCGSEPGGPDEQAAQRDAELIAAAPTAITALLDECDRLTKLCEEACDIATAWIRTYTPGPSVTGDRVAIIRAAVEGMRK